MADGQITYEDWLRGCVHHDGRNGYVTLPIDKVHQIANYIQRTRRSGMDGLIDLEVAEAEMEQVDKDINVRSKDEPYIDIETGILHWCGWKYRRIYEDEQTEGSE